MPYRILNRSQNANSIIAPNEAIHESSYASDEFPYESSDEEYDLEYDAEYDDIRIIKPFDS